MSAIACEIREDMLQLRTINRIKPHPNAFDMGNQVGIVNLLPDGNVDFPREQQIVNTCIQFSKIF